MPNLLLNFTENFLYDLLPPLVLQVDTQKLIQAVVGGYQDRVADLRSFGNNLTNLNSPTASNYGQVFATYTGDAGQQLTVTLDADETTPTATGPALIAWTQAQLGIGLDPTVNQQVTSAALGFDPLREVNVNTLQLLAANLGATLYPGEASETPAQTYARQQRILSTYFPRLKVKGTPVSFVAAAKLAGYDEAAMVPQWSRLAPRTYINSLFQADLQDRPDYWPVPGPNLPDPFYNPLGFTDGPYYRWNSGTTTLIPQTGLGTLIGTNYLLSVVNNQNPFLTLNVNPGLSTMSGSVPLGVYLLAGGAPQQSAYTSVASGTSDSGLTATAVEPGAGFNGVRLTFYGNGTAPQLEILGPLSTVKYRSSYYNFYAWHSMSDSGSVPVAPAIDLQNGLVTPDGPAIAPWRPWSGGQALAPVLSLWPDKAVSGFSGTVAARFQAAGTTFQLDSVTEQSDGQRIFGILSDVKPITRSAGKLTSGYLTTDADGLAPYLAVATLATGTGAFTGVVVPPALGPLTATFYQAGIPLYTEGDGTGLGLLFSGATVAGSYYLPANSWAMTVTSPGTVTVQFTTLNSEQVQVEPSTAAKISGLAAYTNRASGTVAVMLGSIIGTNISTGTAATFDTYPWRSLRQLSSGDYVQSQVFSPMPATGTLAGPTIFGPQHYGDPPAGPQALEALHVADESSVLYRAYALTYSGSFWPPQLNYVEDDVLVRTPAVAQLSTGALVPVMKVGNAVLAKTMWDQPHTSGLVAYYPLTENPNDLLGADEAFSVATVNTGFQPQDRVWDASHGWNLGLSGGNFSAPNIIGTAFGTRLMTTNAYNSTGTTYNFITLGGLGMSILGTNLYAGFIGGTQTGSFALSPNVWNYVEVDTNNYTANLNVVSGALSGTTLTTLSATSTGTLSNNQGLVVQASNPRAYLQDFCVWSTARTPTQLTTLANPPLPSTAVPVLLPHVKSPQDDKYSLQVMPRSGFAFLGAQHPTIERRGLQSTVVRYQGDGGYIGDPEYKRVGLGALQPLPSTYFLGTQGITVPATGALVTGGSWPGPVGFTKSWNSTYGTIYTVSPPYGSTGGVVSGTASTGTNWSPYFSQYNSVVDRIYLQSDMGSVFQCYLDDYGSGPFFLTTPPVRPGYPVSAYPTGFEQPTDAVTQYQVGTYALGVNTLGAVYASITESFSSSSLILTEGQSNITTESTSQFQTEGYTDIPSTNPIYMYMHDRVASVTSPSAFANWLNPNPYGTSLGTPALNQNGVLSFEMPGPVPAGWARILFDIGNLGYVDNDFVGFDVQLSIQATGQAPVYTSGTLLSTGTGNSPRGTSFIEVNLPQAISGTWVLNVTWTNYLSNPIMGWLRSLAIYSITVRNVATKLYQVALTPASSPVLSITPISTINSSMSSGTQSLAPGAWVAYLNNLGQPASWSHESLLYSTTQGADTWNNPSRPAANSLTSSTEWKDDLYVRNPFTLPAITTPAGPGITNLYVTPSKSLYNVGNSVTFIATGTGTGLRYVWYIPGGTTVTTAGTWATTIPSYGANGTISLLARVVDSYGSVASGTLPMYVNIPPTFNYLSATPNNQPAPFSTTLLANVNHSAGTVTGGWYSGTSLIGLGTLVNNYMVSQSQVLTAIAIDSQGGTATENLRVVATDANPPAVTLANFTSTSTANWPVTLNFYAIAADPDGKGLNGTNSVWTFWDGYTTSGYLTAMPNLGTGTLAQAVRTNVVAPLGQQLFNFTATNLDGLSSTAYGVVNFIQNVPPQLQSLTVSDPGVVIGTNIYYAAQALDPEGNTLSYTWIFPTINQILYGPNVAMTTTGMTPGQILSANLNINDGMGGVINPAVPAVGLFQSGVGALVITPTSGGYNTGVSVSVIGQGTTGTIYYTLDGTDPNPLTANVYTSPVVLSPAAGSTMVFTARSFLSNFAPSPKVQATYTFN